MRSRAISRSGDKSVPAEDLHPSRRASLDSRSCCQLLGGVENSSGNPCVAFRGKVDVVMVRDLLKAGEPVLRGVGSLPEAVHNGDDFVVCDAIAVE